MINEDKKHVGDDEYQYPNEEYVAETTPPEEKVVPEKRPNVIVRMMQANKRVTFVIAIVVLALIVFKILGWVNHNKVVTKPVVAQPVVTQPIVTTPSPQVVDELSALRQAAQNNQVVITQLQNQVQDLHNSVAQSTAAQTQLTQSVATIAEQVKELAQTVAASKDKPVVAKKAVPTVKPIVFHLRAVVPGRAWIVSDDGLSESVSMGDTVPQYGTVQVVDANRGMVLTSSGKVIGYGDNDH